MARVLLINPSYYGSYGNAKAALINPVHPTLGIACIAGGALARGHKVEILDMSSVKYDWRVIDERIKAFKPDVVGITATTPLMNQVRDISVLVKDISPNIKVVCGGPHPSSLPYETMQQSLVDAVFVGESDFSFAEYCDGRDPWSILGLYLRDGDEPVFTGWRTPIENLDDLPMPAFHLYNTDEYHDMPRLYARRQPVTMLEFSRGCVFKCDFCASKVAMSLGYRKKSPERCVEEVRMIKKLGFREFHLADDIFTSDQKWAGSVCDALIAADLDMTWTASNGIRVESADDSLFRKMAAAGCYRVSFGFESGNDAVLKAFGKGGRASIEQGRRAVSLARKAGLDTTGFFMVGLSPDTEETMEETIEFARKLPVDLLKFGICIAFPGTPMFDQAVKDGLIRSYDWDDYFVYSPELMFSHRNLSFDVIKKAADRGYRRAVLFNPRFWAQRFVRGLRTMELAYDAYYFVKFSTMGSTADQFRATYFARDRWPDYDFKVHPPRPSQYQKAGTGKVTMVA